MEMRWGLEPVHGQFLATVQALEECNIMTSRYGLALSRDDMWDLAEQRFAVLQRSGRMEFGEGILQKLIAAFCDSPYIWKENYVETLQTLQEMFYHYKEESMERLSDDELLDAMKTTFNGEACGSLSYLSSTTLENLSRKMRRGDANWRYGDER